MRTARARRLAAALLLAAAAGAAGAAELGTLFHAPDERARLERLRRGDTPDRVAAGAAPHEVTGYVSRSDGRGTLWIDGVPVNVSDPKAKPLFDPHAVRGYGERDAVRIERKGAK